MATCSTLISLRVFFFFKKVHDCLHLIQFPAINKNKHFYPLLALPPQINLINLRFFLAYVFIEIQSEDGKSQTDRQCRHCLGECVRVCVRLSALSVSQSVSLRLSPWPPQKGNGGSLEQTGGTMNPQTSGIRFRWPLLLTFRLFMRCVLFIFSTRSFPVPWHRTKSPAEGFSPPTLHFHRSITKTRQMSSLAQGDYGSRKCEMYFNSTLNTLCLERRTQLWEITLFVAWGVFQLACSPIWRAVEGSHGARRRGTQMICPSAQYFLRFSVADHERSIKWTLNCASSVQIQYYFNVPI